MTDIVDIGMKVDSRDVKTANKNLGVMEKQSGKTQKATDGLTSSFKKYASLALVGVAIGKSIALHREFTKSISELSAITGATGKDLAFYRKEAMALGSTTTFSASQVATAFKLVASAKPDLLASKEALAAVTRETLTLAEAAGMTLPEAANALGSSLNQFSAGADQASRFINVLAAGSKLGASEVTETSLALKNVGAVAASVGLTFEETNAAIQGLASVSIKGAEAGTGLRGVLLKLAKQSNADFNPEIVGLTTALDNLKAANLSTTDKMEIFGLESATAATALINQAGAVGKLTADLKGTSIAYEQARINTNNLDGDLKGMESAWEGVALTLGAVFDPALRSTTQFLTSTAKIAKSLVIEFGDLGDMMGAYAAIAASVLTLDFEQAGVIIDLRKEERKLTDEKISAIWAEKSATDSLNESKMTDTAIVAEEGGGGEGDMAEMSEAIRAEKAAEAHRVGLEDKLIALEEFYMTDEEMAIMDYERKLAQIQEFEDAKLEVDGEYNDIRLSAAQEFTDKMKDIAIKGETATAKAKERLRKQEAKSALSTGKSLLAGAAKQSKEAFEMNKIAAISNAVIKGKDAAVSAWDAGMSTGGPWAPILAALYTGVSIANTASMIDGIKSQSFGGGGGGAVSVSAGSAGGAAAGATAGAPEGAAAPAGEEAKEDVKSVSITLSGAGYSKENVRELIGQINEEIGEGVSLEAG